MRWLVESIGYGSRNKYGGAVTEKGLTALGLGSWLSSPAMVPPQGLVQPLP